MIGIGGAGMRNLARLLLARGVGGERFGHQGLGVSPELAALGARISAGHDPGSVGSPDAVIVSSAIRDTDPSSSSPAGRRRRPCGAGSRRSPRWPGPSRRRRGRHAREVDDDLDDRRDPGARRARSHVPDRRGPERERERRAIRRRRPVRLRGRRERRIVPHDPAVGRRRHERRRRSRRVLSRWPRRDHRRVRGVRRAVRARRRLR